MIREKNNVAEANPEIVSDLEIHLHAYARVSKWLKAQPAFLGAKGRTILDPDYNIGDAGLAHERPSLQTT